MQSPEEQDRNPYFFDPKPGLEPTAGQLEERAEAFKKKVREIINPEKPVEIEAEMDEWQAEDCILPEDQEIDATHPAYCHTNYKEDAEAMRLVGAKRSKQALVDLVRWLLVRIKKTEDERDEEGGANILNRNALRRQKDRAEKAEAELKEVMAKGPEWACRSCGSLDGFTTVQHPAGDHDVSCNQCGSTETDELRQAFNTVVRSLEDTQWKRDTLDEILTARIGRSVPVENALLEYSMGKRELTKDDARKLAIKLGVPDDWETKKS